MVLHPEGLGCAQGPSAEARVYGCALYVVGFGSILFIGYILIFRPILVAY